jgi:hypothetical protein
MKKRPLLFLPRSSIDGIVEHLPIMPRLVVAALDYYPVY